MNMQACDRIDECVPQALSNMIWACATLRHHHKRFIEAVAGSAAPRLDTFQSQTLANTLWAYSVLGVYPSFLFNAAAEEIVERLVLKEKAKASLKAYKSLKKPRIMQGKTTGKTSRVKGVSKTIGRDQRAYYEFRGQEISNVLIAYARGCIIHPKLLESLEAELCSTRTIEQDGKLVKVERLQQFTSQALTNTLWAFATLRWYPARLLPCITQAMGRLARVMTAQELANSLWSYARFAYHPGRVMWSFLAVISQRIDEFEAQGCTNSLWALAVLKATHSPAFVQLLERYVSLERTAVSFGELQYNQVLQAVLLAQFEARGGRVAWRPEVDLPEDVVDRALDAWASQQTSTQLSGFHLDVSEGLSRLGISHLIEHLVARDLLSIDIAVITDGRLIAIEVDGPFHFPVNARTPLGHTMIRRRLLRAAGWTVVPIPWYEWFAMKTWDERLQYLARVLANADESLLTQFQPSVRELLSTEFCPGPGLLSVDMEASQANDSKNETEIPGDEDIEDGPVLSYSDTVYSSDRRENSTKQIETGLMEALSRSNVQLTSGAIRRLKSMGLESSVKEILSRKRQKGKYQARQNSENPPPSSIPRVSADGLLPKPARKMMKDTRAKDELTSSGTRFNPRFVDSDAGVWSPYWNTQYIPDESSESDDEENKDLQEEKKSGSKRKFEDIPSKSSDKMIRRVLHGRNSASKPREDEEDNIEP